MSFDNLLFVSNQASGNNNGGQLDNLGSLSTTSSKGIGGGAILFKRMDADTVVSNSLFINNTAWNNANGGSGWSASTNADSTSALGVGHNGGGAVLVYDMHDMVFQNCTFLSNSVQNTANGGRYGKTSDSQ